MNVLWAPAIGDTPDCAVSVLADEKRAVMGHRDPDGRAQTEESFASPAAFPEMRSSRATRAANGATFSMASQTATAQRLAGAITRSISWIALSRSVKNMRPN